MNTDLENIENVYVVNDGIYENVNSIYVVKNGFYKKACKILKAIGGVWQAVYEGILKFIITYNANGGTPDVNMVTYEDGVDVSGAYVEPTRTGYTFDEWCTDQSLTNKLDISTLKSDITAYAKWIANTYYVRFDGNGATSGTMDDQKFTYDVTQNLTANAFQRQAIAILDPNYTGATVTTRVVNSSFQGWDTSTDGISDYSDSEAVSNLTAIKDAIVTLYAKWLSGTIQLTSVSRTGYTFNGWYTGPSGGSKVGVAGDRINVVVDRTLYAHWTGNSYTIQFSANGGSGTMSNLSMTYGTSKPLPANTFTRTGCTFLGWSKSALPTSSTTATYADKALVTNLTSTQGGTITLHAVWKGNSYTIKFNAKGGTGTMSNMSMTYGIAKNLTANKFTKSGYTFQGWSKSSLSNTVTYRNGQSVNNLTASDGGTVNLYAVWKKTS